MWSKLQCEWITKAMLFCEQVNNTMKLQSVNVFFSSPTADYCSFCYDIGSFHRWNTLKYDILIKFNAIIPKDTLTQIYSVQSQLFDVIKTNYTLRTTIGNENKQMWRTIDRKPKSNIVLPTSRYILRPLTNTLSSSHQLSSIYTKFVFSR